MSNLRNLPPYSLIAGDVLAALAVTLIGFATHGETIASPRVLTTFVPLCLAWGLISPWMGVYHADNYLAPRQVWRPVLAMFLASPLAALLRGLWLNSLIPPIFVVALGASAALAFGLWRLIYALAFSRTAQHG
jgi:hypothetical protein